MKLSPSLAAATSAISPLQRSQAFTIAIRRAAAHPEALSQALQARLDYPQGDEEISKIDVCVSHPPELTGLLSKLAKASRLSRDEVIRLALEAYIKQP